MFVLRLICEGVWTHKFNPNCAYAYLHGCATRVLIIILLVYTSIFQLSSRLSRRNVLHPGRLHQPPGRNQHRGHQRCGGKDPIAAGLFHSNSRAVRVLPFGVDRIRVGQRFPLLAAGPQRPEAPRRFGLIDDDDSSSKWKSRKAFITIYLIYGNSIFIYINIYTHVSCEKKCARTINYVRSYLPTL